MIFKIFLPFSDVPPPERKKEKKDFGSGSPTARQLQSSSPPSPPPSPRRASRAGLCQRLNKRLRPLDARPVTSPIHKTWTGCQAGAARAVAMETANPAPLAARGPASHLRTSGRRPGNALRTGAVAGRGSPYLLAPHLESPHRARSLAPPPHLQFPHCLGKGARVPIPAPLLGEFSGVSSPLSHTVGPAFW